MDSLVDRPRAPRSKVGPAVSAPPIPPLTASIKEENPLDRVAHANIAKLCGGFSPLAIAVAAADWALHLGVSPGRQSALALSAIAEQVSLVDSALAPLRGGASHAPMRTSGPLTAVLRRKTGDSGHFTRTAFSPRSDGGRMRRPTSMAPRPIILRSSTSLPARRWTPLPRPISWRPIRSRSSRPCARAASTWQGER